MHFKKFVFENNLVRCCFKQVFLWLVEKHLQQLVTDFLLIVFLTWKLKFKELLFYRNNFKLFAMSLISKKKNHVFYELVWFICFNSVCSTVKMLNCHFVTF